MGYYGASGMSYYGMSMMVYYGLMVYGNYDQVAIQPAMWHILRLLVSVVWRYMVVTIIAQFRVQCDIFRGSPPQAILNSESHYRPFYPCRISLPKPLCQSKKKTRAPDGFKWLYLMRQEQRSIATKTNELQQDLNEHNIVIETLNGVDGDRKCFRYRSL